MEFQDGDCPTSISLQTQLLSFHEQIKSHCGVTTPLNDHTSNQPVVISKLQRLLSLIKDSESVPKQKLFSYSKASKLQKVIVDTMVRWSKEKIVDFELPDKIYSVLYRQFNETECLIQALERTYVIEHTAEFCTGGILRFQSALGQLRQLLQVGTSREGDEEEKLLKDNME